MNPQHFRQQTDRLRAIPLPEVLVAAGAKPDRYDKARWHTPAGVISLSGMKFYNWNRDRGGGGAIDLVIHLYELDFRSALAWLSHRFTALIPAPPPSSSQKTSLKLPVPQARTLPAVKHYLATERAIDDAVLNRLILSGRLYADAHANAVFLLLGKQQCPVGAELRGTIGRPWRGMARGSQKNLGYFSIRDTHIERIVLCESAIDAISCFLIQPHSWCISTAGARPDPPWLPAISRIPIPVYCGFDADEHGDAAAANMIQRHPSTTRLRPPKHDWNDALKARR